jgi:hypothetical protein
MRKIRIAATLPYRDGAFDTHRGIIDVEENPGTNPNLFLFLYTLLSAFCLLL